MKNEPTTSQVVNKINKIEGEATKAYNAWNRNRPATCSMDPEEDYLFWIVRQMMIEEAESRKSRMIKTTDLMNVGGW